MKPKAIRSLALLRGPDGLLRFEMVDAGREVVLDPLAELLWDLSDGSRSLDALAQAAGRAFNRVVDQEEVFSALDFLADAGLIEERVAPPVAEGKVSRRSLLVKMAPVVGAAAWMMSGGSARAGGVFQEGGEKVSKASESGEKSSKANQSNANESNGKEWNNKEPGQKDWESQWKGRMENLRLLDVKITSSRVRYTKVRRSARSAMTRTMLGSIQYLHTIPW